MTRDALPRLMMLALAVMLLTACGFNPAFEKAQGKKAFDRGDYAAAAERYYPVTQQASYDWEAHYYLGLCYLELRQPVKAQTELEQALAVKENSKLWAPSILDGLAEAYYQQERYDAMYTFLRQAIDRYGSWQDYARQARYMAKAGDNDGAALAYRKAVFFSNNEQAGIYIEMADFFESIANYPASIQALKWAKYIDDQDTAIDVRLRRLGVVPGPTTKEKPPTPEYPGDSRIPAL